MGKATIKGGAKRRHSQFIRGEGQKAVCGGGEKQFIGEEEMGSFVWVWPLGRSQSGEKWSSDPLHLKEGLLRNLPLLCSMQGGFSGLDKSSSNASKVVGVRSSLTMIFLKRTQLMKSKRGIMCWHDISMS